MGKNSCAIIKKDEAVKKGVLGVVILSAWLSATAHEADPAIPHSLGQAVKQQKAKHTNKPLYVRIEKLADLPIDVTAQALDLITDAPRPSSPKKLTRAHTGFAAGFTSTLATINAAGMYAAGVMTQKSYQDGNYIGVALFGLATLWESAVTGIICCTSLLFVRKTITGPTLDE